MTKWADYGISAVRYNPEKTHIAAVKAHVDNGDTMGPPQEWMRRDVVSALEHGNTFVTILNSGGTKWNIGQDVHFVIVNGVKYIRTDKNSRASDNLENLPEF